MQLSDHDPVVAACCLRSLIVVGALRHDEFVSDEDVIETVLGWIRLTAADVRDRQQPIRPSLLDLLVLSRMYSEVIEEGVTQSMDFVAAEELILQESRIVVFGVRALVPVVAVEAEDDRSANLRYPIIFVLPRWCS